jgi:TM2 domain-containing membrane protein YozV
MNCHYHPDRDVVRECCICHELICSECAVPVGEHAVCKTCVSQTMVLDESGDYNRYQAIVPKAGKKDKKAQKAITAVKRKVETLNAGHKSFFLTTLFSCLPGLGHYYLGQQVRGVHLMIIFFFLIFLNTIVPNSLMFATGVAVPILWFYSQVDAHKYRDAINRGETVADRPIFPRWKEWLHVSVLGWAFAILGGAAFCYSLIDLAGVNDWQLREALKEMVTAVLLFGAGFWILKGKPLPFPPLMSAKESDDGEHA